jgi:hypothetical protein
MDLCPAELLKNKKGVRYMIIKTPTTYFITYRACRQRVRRRVCCGGALGLIHRHELLHE